MECLTIVVCHVILFPRWGSANLWHYYNELVTCSVMNLSPVMYLFMIIVIVEVCALDLHSLSILLIFPPPLPPTHTHLPAERHGC